jgi:hypothetical protein
MQKGQSLQSRQFYPFDGLPHMHSLLPVVNEKMLYLSLFIIIVCVILTSVQHFFATNSNTSLVTSIGEAGKSSLNFRTYASALIINSVRIGLFLMTVRRCKRISSISLLADCLLDSFLE